MAKKAHHYIPRFYLCNFVDKDTPPGQTPYLWVFEKGKLASYKRSPQNVAKKTRYYALESHQWLSETSIENLFSHIESKAAPILKKLALGDGAITPEQRDVIATFLVLMKLRVPQFRENLDYYIETRGKFITKVMAAEKERLERLMSTYESDTGNRVNISVDELREYLLSDRYNIKANPDYNIGLMLALVPNLVPIVFYMKWALLLPDDNRRRFVTSDNPVVTVNATVDPPLFNAGFFDPDIELSFPIRPNLALLVSWKGQEGPIRVPFRDIRLINMRTIMNAGLYVFSDSNANYISKIVSSCEPRKKGDEYTVISEKDSQIVIKRPLEFPR